MKWLFLCAHPDDLEFFLGHLIVALNAKRDDPHVAQVTSRYIHTTTHDVKIMSMTRGEMSFYTSETHSTLKAAKVRTSELSRSCQIMGVPQPEFLGLFDGFVRVSESAIEQLKRILEREKPDIVVAPEPEFTFYGHPDHCRTGKIAYYALRRALKSSPAQWKPRLFYFGAFLNQFYFPKLRAIKPIISNALRQHQSQAALLRGADIPFRLVALMHSFHTDESWQAEALRFQPIHKRQPKYTTLLRTWPQEIAWYKKLIFYLTVRMMSSIDYTSKKSFIDGTLPPTA